VKKEEENNDENSNCNEFYEQLERIRKDDPYSATIFESLRKQNPDFYTLKDPRYVDYKNFMDQIDNSTILTIDPLELNN